ncbi:hypothetical protein ACG7TL_003288 [Trametes sanguinea]
MESFFWLLLNVCITSSGPGGERREELPDELTGEIDAEQISDVCDVVYRPFEGPFGTIARNKKTLFELPQQFESTILCHVHPYYDPLKPLLRRRWQLLILAYIFQGYEFCNIHKFVIQLLEDALRDLEDRGPPGDAQQHDGECGTMLRWLSAAGEDDEVEEEDVVEDDDRMTGPETGVKGDR